LVVGQSVINGNLPAGTYIRRILNGTQIELSAMSTNASVQNSQTLNFGAASFANSQTINDVALTSSATITVNPGSGSSTTRLSLGNVAGSGALTKLGSGTLSLTGSLTYTGNTAVSAGTMDFAPVSGTSTLTGNITGSGAITKSGNGTTIFAGGVAGNTISGTLAVNGGTLQIGSSTTANDSSQRLTLISSATVAPAATLVLNNSAALADGNAPITLAGNLTGDTTGIASGGFHNRLGALTMNGGTLTTYNGASLGFQAYALRDDVAVGGSSASTVAAGGTSGNNGIHLASSAAGVTRIFDVADATSSPAADLIVSARLLNSSNAGEATGLTKSGAGTMLLSGTNSYTGATNVTGGTLIVNGNISTSSLTTVAIGATLGGSGSVGATIVNGTFAPGNSPGTLTITDTLGLNGVTVMEIDGNNGAGVTGGHDFVNLTGAGAAGALTYGGALTLDMGTIFTTGSYSWDLFDMASETGTFATIALADPYSGNLLDADLDGVWDLTSGSNTWQFTESTGVLGLTVVPEPNAAAIIGGFGVLALLRRRR
jgi:autotransporter-associated beta strand protein